MKNIYLLGATGSIGRQVLEVVEKYPEEFKVITLTANKRIQELIPLIEKYKPDYCGVATQENADMLADMFSNIVFGYGKSGLIHAATYRPKDNDGVLVNALVGIAGLHPTVEAIKIKRNVLLANKETLVVGGFLIKELINQYNVKLYPIDSEHSAIWQCLNGESINSVKRIIITASGGAFREKSMEELKNVTKSEALAHPNWSMGEKITIDSATMMNKGFEMIEAAYLFDVKMEQIETIIHKESIIHSMVEFDDHSVMAQLSSHDMRLPIQYAMMYPKRLPSLSKPLNFAELKSLHFEVMDESKYPCLGYAKWAFQQGGSMLCILNAANEAAVDLFLQEKIAFLDIPKIIEQAFNKHPYIAKPTLDEILMLDEIVKADVYSIWKE